VVDASMVDGASLLMSMAYGFWAEDAWELERGVNKLDGGAPFYGVYECADGRHLSVGAIEPQFYARLIELTGADPGLLARQDDRSAWPTDRAALAGIFVSRTRDEWCEALEDTDACVSPVLDMVEASGHPHNVARGTFFHRGGAVHVAPAPRLSRTPPRPGADHRPGDATCRVLARAGFDGAEIDRLLAEGIVAQADEARES
jgi:alpha-methylacyl-CoA racemase